jgi:hypothetical protein
MKMSRRPIQQGVITVVVALLLVAGVLLILTQTTGIIRNRSMDTTQDADSAAALMLAESGLQRALAIVNNAQTGGTFAASTCTGIAISPFTVGRGTVSYQSAVESPSGCAANACNTCTVTATGTVGSTQRTVSEIFSLGTVNGTTGHGKTVNMLLRNTYTQPAIALFNLVWRRQSNGGNANATLTPCASCTIQWNLSSSSGNPSDGGMGISVPIAGGGVSETITQTLDKDRDYVEVGGLFPSADTTTPTVVGSYWSNVNPSATETAPNSGNSGGTNSGVVVGDATPCTGVPTSSGTSTQQACHTWCLGADTLVFGIAGRRANASTATNAQANTVVFNQTGTPAQNISLTKIVHFPNTDGTTTAASYQIYSEAWYAINPQYNATSNLTTGANGVTTYTGAIVGASVAGATLGFTGSGKINNNSTTGTISSITGGSVCVGNTITGSGLASGTTVAQLNGSSSTSTCFSTAGAGVAIVIAPKATGTVSSANVQSNKLQATATIVPLAAASATVLSGGTTISISSGPDASGIYTLSAPATISSGYIVQGSGTSTTVNVASASDLPAANSQVLSVYSTTTSPAGTGALAAGTKVSTVGTSSFTLSAAPTTPLIGATLCAGICAFFNNPSSASSTTDFSITTTATAQWSGGFMCLKGVVQDSTKIIPVTSSSITKRTWAESIQ